MSKDLHFTNEEQQDPELLKALRAAIGPAPKVDFSAYGDFDFEDF
jgi:hypothetical protein